jgi:hypothetical protein
MVEQRFGSDEGRDVSAHEHSISPRTACDADDNAVRATNRGPLRLLARLEQSVVSGKERGDGVVNLGGALVHLHRTEMHVLVLVVMLGARLRDLRHAPLVLGKRSFSVYSAHFGDTRPSPDRSVQPAPSNAR